MLFIILITKDQHILLDGYCSIINKTRSNGGALV